MLKLKNILLSIIILSSLTCSGQMTPVSSPINTNIKYRVIKVIDGDTIYIDFNKDGFPQKEEKVRINGIDTFEVKPSKFLDCQMKTMNLSQDEALGLGYLGKEFAKKHLLNKYVVVKYTGDKKFCDMGRHLMSIWYDNGKSYEQEILKAGLGIVYRDSNIADNLYQYENIDKIKKKAKRSRSFNLVLLNKKNGKYHKPTCEYGLMSSDAELVKRPFKKYQGAGCCYPKQEKKTKKYKIRKLNPSRDITIYFVNPLKNKYPKNECKNKTCKGLLNLINSSTKSIDFALYGFEEQDEILNALIQAKERGVAIRGIVDKDEGEYYKDTYKLNKLLGNVKVDKFTSIAAQKSHNKEFTRATHALMHNKFFIVDNSFVWTGSTNVSANCMTFNANNAVIIKSDIVAKIYKKEFEQMFLDSKFHTDKSINPNTSNIMLNKGKTSISIYFSPQSKPITNYVKPLIQTAEKSIHINMFFLTHKKIVEELINAHNRGVDVKIILDGSFVSDGYSPHEKLREKGIPVKIENWNGKMHMKTAVIDKKYSILGSTNWTTTAELVNDENMLIIKDSYITREIKKNFQKCWKSIPDEWLFKTPEKKEYTQR